MTKIRLRLVNYKNPMPLGFNGKGYESLCGRYFFSNRAVRNINGHLINWGVIDWQTGLCKDQFCYRRDAVKFVEAGGFDNV